MQKGKFNIVIGGQAGSESKGKLSAYLSDVYKPEAFFMSSSPNAGHTVVDDKGHKHVSYHLPIGSIMSPSSVIILGPASLINTEILLKEVRDLRINPTRIHIDPRAALIRPSDMAREIQKENLSDIGSTLQGVGSARMKKLMRRHDTPLIGDIRLPDELSRINITDTVRYLHDLLYGDIVVLCEMTQGFDLCLEHGIHPRYCTSKMINPMMALAEAGVPPKYLGTVYGVIRPYPIRVNNRTGTSGPYADAEEITWDIVAKECNYPFQDTTPIREITTTTKLPRRVFRFPWERYLRFLDICDPDSICLQFANYVNWEDYCKTEFSELSMATRMFIDKLDNCGAKVEFIGTGPQHQHMIHRYDDVGLTTKDWPTLCTNIYNWEAT